MECTYGNESNERRVLQIENVRIIQEKKLKDIQDELFNKTSIKNIENKLNNVVTIIHQKILPLLNPDVITTNLNNRISELIKQNKELQDEILLHRRSKSLHDIKMIESEKKIITLNKNIDMQVDIKVKDSITENKNKLILEITNIKNRKDLEIQKMRNDYNNQIKDLKNKLQNKEILLNNLNIKYTEFEKNFTDRLDKTRKNLSNLNNNLNLKNALYLKQIDFLKSELKSGVLKIMTILELFIIKFGSTKELFIKKFDSTRMVERTPPVKKSYEGINIINATSKLNAEVKINKTNKRSETKQFKSSQFSTKKKGKKIKSVDIKKYITNIPLSVEKIKEKPKKNQKRLKTSNKEKKKEYVTDIPLYTKKL